MGRPPLAPGGWGAIRPCPLEDGRTKAHGRYRAADRGYHSREATGPDRAVERARHIPLGRGQGAHRG